MNKILKKKEVIFFLLLLLIVLVLNIYFAFYINEFDNTSGVFGDSWGFSNAIFSLIATLFIIISIYKQGEEIKDQSFDSSLMSLISNHNDLTSQISFKKISGKNVFKYHFKQVQDKDVIEIRSYFRKHLREDFGHYFSNIYRILKYIDINKNLKKNSHYDNKHESVSYQFAAIYRSQFTVYELFWLQAYVDDNMKDSALEEKSREKVLKNLVEKFSFLKHTTLDDDKYNKVFRITEGNKLMNNAYVPKSELNDG